MAFHESIKLFFKYVSSLPILIRFWPILHTSMLLVMLVGETVLIHVFYYSAPEHKFSRKRKSESKDIIYHGECFYAIKSLPYLKYADIDYTYMCSN